MGFRESRCTSTFDLLACSHILPYGRLACICRFCRPAWLPVSPRRHYAFALKRLLMGAKRDIGKFEGQKITAEAATWNGTPYSLLGALSFKSRGGDCSGSTSNIFEKAGFKYEHKSAHTFQKYATESGLFREVAAQEPLQDGDILSWPHHMAIYSTFTSSTECTFANTLRTNKSGEKWTQRNDMWTAHHTGGNPYGPAARQYWPGARPKAFRRLVDK